MSIKAWHIENDWQEAFVEALTRRGASGEVVSQALGEVDDALSVHGTTAREHFGDPQAYAQRITLADPALARASRTRAVLLAVLGLVGMFLALWGFAGVAREVDSLIGMSPMIPLIAGLVIAVGAAIADSVLGHKADIYQAGSAEAGGIQGFVLNRLGPWLVVLFTLVGMLLLWVRYR